MMIDLGSDAFRRLRHLLTAATRQADLPAFLTCAAPELAPRLQALVWTLEDATRLARHLLTEYEEAP